MEYKPEELKRVQEIEVEILQEIIRVCEQYGFKYWVYGGTLIGTIRHDGFIPWDDDIDIGMMRDDFEKFIEVAPAALNKGYTLQHFKTDPKTPTYHAKVRKDGTEFVEWYARNMDIHQGIFVDIMPHDLIPENEEERAKYRKTAEWRKQLFIAKSVTDTTITHGKKVWIRTLERRILHVLMLPFSKRWLYERVDSYMRQYNGTNSHIYLSVKKQYELTKSISKIKENTATLL